VDATLPGSPAPPTLVVRSPNPRAGGLCLAAAFAGTLAGGLSTVAVVVSYPILVLLFAYGVRGLFVMARCSATGIKIRNQWRTVTLPWAEVVAIADVPRGAERQALRAAGVVESRDGRRIPVQATYLSQDAAVPAGRGPDLGGPKVEAIRRCWQQATASG
jgi:hypothetical protein